MKEEIKKYWCEFTKGTRKMFKEFFKKETNKKQRANMWTFSRLVIPLLTILNSTIALIIGNIPFLIAASTFAGFGAITDYFDGKSSRKHNSTSEYGKILDQITDKVFSGLIGINLLFININYLMIIFGELLIASTNIYYKNKYKDININSTKIGKIKQFPLFVSLSLGYLSNINGMLNIISNISIVVTFFIQIATSYSYVINNNKEVESMNFKENNNNLEEIITDYNKKNVNVKQLDKEFNSDKLQHIRNKKNNLNCLKSYIKESIENDEITYEIEQSSKKNNFINK